MAKYNLVSRVDWRTLRPNRAGVIVYTCHHNKLIFAFGSDTLYDELTDFGGGVKYHKDGNAVNGALRELMEESLYVFGVVKESQVQTSFVIYDEATAIFFVYLKTDPKEVSHLFRRRSEVLDYLEVNEIVWLTLPELIKALGQSIIYSKVRDLIVSSGLFT